MSVLRTGLSLFTLIEMGSWLIQTRKLLPFSRCAASATSRHHALRLRPSFQSKNWNRLLPLAAYSLLITCYYFFYHATRYPPRAVLLITDHASLFCFCHRLLAMCYVPFCASAPAFALRCLVLALLRRPPPGVMLSASVCHSSRRTGIAFCLWLLTRY